MELKLTHYEVIAELLKSQQGGQLATMFHYDLNAAFRKANMKGAQIRTMEQLSFYMAPARFQAFKAAVAEALAEAA